MLTTQSFLVPPAPFTTEYELVKDPLGPLAPEEVYMVPSDSGEKEYKVLRRKNYYQCNCPAFVYQFNTFWEHRTCKHIIRLRGQEAEDTRIKAAKIDRYGPTGERPDISSAPHAELVLGPLAMEEKHEVVGSAGQIYTIMRRKNYYQCTCPAFRYQKGISWECRTCKHIKELRGEKSEICRTMAAKIRLGEARQIADTAKNAAARKLKNTGSVKRVSVKKNAKDNAKGAVKVKMEPVDEPPSPAKTNSANIAVAMKGRAMKIGVKKEPAESTATKAMKKVAVKKESMAMKKESMTVKKESVKKEPKKSGAQKAVKKVAVKKEPTEPRATKAIKTVKKEPMKSVKKKPKTQVA